MTAPLGLLLLGVEDDGLVEDVRSRVGEGLLVARSAAGLAGARAVVGVAGSPWPGWDRYHDTARRTVDAPYYAVQSWHRHPVLVEALVRAARRGLAELDGAHVLLTAPDPAGRAVAPEERLFLREAVEAVAEAGDLPGTTIAWDHALDEHATAPTVSTVLTSLAEAHGRHRVVRCALGPGTPRDPRADEVAAALGMQLRQVAPDADDLVACLAAVAETVTVNEGSL